MSRIPDQSVRVAGEPPTPPGDWWFGNLLDMRADPLGYLARVARDFGGIVKLRFKKNTVYLVSEPDLIKELLIDHGRKYRKNTRYQFMRRVLGQGLLLSEGETWRAQRKTAQPFFTPKGIAERTGDIARIAAEVADSWRPLADSGEPLETEAAFSRLAQRQALQFIVGPLHEPVADAIAHEVEISVNAWPERPHGRLGGLKPPNPWRLARLKHSLDRTDALFFGMIDQFRARPTDDAGMLPALVDALDPGWTRQQQNQRLRDQLVTLFLAAFETSASGLCWTMYLLDQHPDVLARVEEEVDRILGGRAPTADDLPRFEYLDRVISESLRLYSPIHSLSRIALEDDTIGGYPIPAGSTVMVSLYATHRLPNHWPDPDRFDPDRFLPERSAGRHRYAYIPFAIGHRACLGGKQAMVNATINIATIVQRYRLRLAPGHRVEPDPRTTMRPKFGMNMLLERRRRRVAGDTDDAAFEAPHQSNIGDAGMVGR